MTSSGAPPDPLRAVRDAVRDTLRASGRARRRDVETCLDVSARHVGVALWASGLERIWRTNEAVGNPPLLGLDHALLITATPTLLFGSAVTALDQCVAAAAFYEAASVNGGFKNRWGNWYATGDLYQGSLRASTPFAAPLWFDAWFDGLIADPAWDLTKPFRNRQLHQVQPRSAAISVPTITATVHVGGSPASPPPPSRPAQSVEQFGSTLNSTGLDVNKHYDEVGSFTLRHWSSFWQQF